MSGAMLGTSPVYPAAQRECRLDVVNPVSKVPDFPRSRPSSVAARPEQRADERAATHLSHAIGQRLSARVGGLPVDYDVPSVSQVDSGLSPVTVTPTGRIFQGGDVEYKVTVSGLSLDLVPGVYFMNVSPVAQAQIYYVGSSDGTNAVGRAGPSNVLQEDISG
jgi:hypothetical protein